MSEEQKLILNMLKEGKISVEEAERLIDNLNVAAPQPEPPPAKRPVSIMENIVETLRSGFSGFGFGFSDSSRIVLEDRYSGEFSSKEVKLDLDVRSGKVLVEPSEDNSFYLEVTKRIRAATREQAEQLIAGYKFAEYDGRILRAGDTKCRSLGNRVSVSLCLRLPRNHYYSGNITSRNGTLELSGIDVGAIDAHTVNGAVRIGKINGKSVVTGTVNGSITIEGSLENLEAKTTNGSITVYGMAEDSKICLKTVNGRISVQVPVRADIGLSVDARATSGNVRVNHAHLGELNEWRIGAGRRIDGSTGNWERAPHRISLYLRSVNGGIGISELE